jgi:DNA-binding transcriptional ArsR family regulator
MARSATTSDAFNAIAEPQRRRILELLTGGEQTVGEIAESLHFKQPQTSKHLGVLKQVGLVNVRGSGQQRFYTLNGKALKNMYEWLKTFEQFWDESLDRLEQYIEELKRDETKQEGNADDEPQRQ